MCPTGPLCEAVAFGLELCVIVVLTDIYLRGSRSSDPSVLTGARQRQRHEALPSVVCLLAARLNHSCSGNACHWYEAGLKVKIVMATRPIAQGEEITIQYLDPADAASSQDHAVDLKAHWGIECRTGCLCQNEIFLERRHELSELQRHVADTKQLDQVAKIRELHADLGSPAIVVLQDLHTWGEVMTARRTTLPKAKQLAQEAKELSVSAFGSSSAVAATFAPYAEDITKHRNYLALDR